MSLRPKVCLSLPRFHPSSRLLLFLVSKPVVSVLSTSRLSVAAVMLTKKYVFSSRRMQVSSKIQTFLETLPFHAPALVDLIREGWWANPKALGVTKLESHRIDRPTEVVLPDAMICLSGANVSVFCRRLFIYFGSDVLFRFGPRSSLGRLGTTSM
jgi:hypothetical protein